MNFGVPHEGYRILWGLRVFPAPSGPLLCRPSVYQAQSTSAPDLPHSQVLGKPKSYRLLIYPIMYMYMCIYTHVCVYIYIYICTYMCVYIYILYPYHAWLLYPQEFADWICDFGQPGSGHTFNARLSGEALRTYRMKRDDQDLWRSS